jgi:hypothetical protein
METVTDARSPLETHNSLLNVVLHDAPDKSA